MQISVVIITKNEEANIVDCIASARLISNDIIVVDSGSSDATILLAECLGTKVISVVWNGYGNTRNIGTKYTLHNWILALDADERITPALADCIKQIHLPPPQNVYGFKRLNFIEGKDICYGSLGFDRVFRLYNKSCTEWQNVPVHEVLTGRRLQYYTLHAKALHYGHQNLEIYWQKKMKYAALWATKQLQNRKNYSFPKHVASTVTSFLKAYIFQFGFLDFQHGFKLARMNAVYTWHKYRLFSSLVKANQVSQTENKSLLISSVAK